jgi:hypothetical protein
MIDGPALGTDGPCHAGEAVAIKLESARAVAAVVTTVGEAVRRELPDEDPAAGTAADGWLGGIMQAAVLLAAEHAEVVRVVVVRVLVRVVDVDAKRERAAKEHLCDDAVDRHVERADR